MKRIILVILLVLTAVMFFSNFLFCEAVAVLDEHMKPGVIAVDDNQLYVTEGAFIYIYSLPDFKLKKKFGSAGSGPQEFMVTPQMPLLIHVGGDDIIVNSLGKVSVFSKDGVFKREMRLMTAGGAMYIPFKDGFVGQSAAAENNILYITVNIFDSQLKKGKEIYRAKSPVQQTGKIELLKQNILFYPYDDIIFIAGGGEGFHIDAVDQDSKKLFSITQKYRRIKMTAEDQKNIRQFLRITYKEQYEIVRQRIVLPDYYPEIAYIFVADKKLFVVTWNRKKNKAEFVVFDLKGKLVKQLYLPFQFQDGIRGFPWTIKNGILYQLIENPDTEKWELHVHKIRL